MPWPAEIFMLLSQYSTISKWQGVLGLAYEGVIEAKRIWLLFC